MDQLRAEEREERVDWGLGDCGGAEGRMERQVGLDTPLSPQEEEVGVLCDGEGGAPLHGLVDTGGGVLLWPL